MFENNIQNVYKIVVSRVKTFIVRNNRNDARSPGRCGTTRNYQGAVNSVHYIYHPS